MGGQTELTKVTPINEEAGTTSKQNDSQAELVGGETGGMIETVKIKHGFLTYFTLVLTMAATLQGGFALGESGLVGYILATKNDWEKEGYFTVLTQLTIAGQAGLAIGSLVSEKWVNICGGIRRGLIISNILAIGTCGLKLIEWLPSLLAGRFLFGVFCGIQQFCMTRALNDTCPQKVSQFYTQFINGGLGAGIFVANLIGMLLPMEDNENPANSDLEMLEDENWRLVYGFCIVLEILSVAIILLTIPHLSLSQLIQDGKNAEAKEIIGKIYDIDQMETAEKEKFANEMIKTLSQQTSKAGEQISLKEALTTPKYRFATWNGFVCAIMNPLAGVAGSLFFQSKIFLDLRESGDFTLIPVIWSVQIMNFINMVASFGSFIPSKYLGQRLNLIGGYHCIYLSLAGVVICNKMDIGLGILFFILLHIVSFQFSVGPISMTHASETCVDSALGFVTLSLFSAVVGTSILTPIMIEQMGVSGCFGFYGVCSVLATLYLHIYFRDTTYKYVKVEQSDGSIELSRVHLNEKEKKELYMPEKFKQVEAAI